MTSLLRHSHVQMHKYEREDKLRDLLRSGVTGQSHKGVLQVVFTVKSVVVCRRAWQKCYGVSDTLIEKLVREIKGGVQTSTVPNMDDGTGPVTAYDMELVDIAKKFSIKLTPQTWAGVLLPNGSASKYTYCWLSEYFNICGDFIPNANEGEIHLEPTTVCESVFYSSLQLFYIE